ncbi:hypothetical protein FOL47_007650 [Perkinsus chesapeaki]|uniref:Uncharacterized protein n=1 Tax=Perkinsus chesapeaki TaxID=330153 RepID=A0A7J6MV66_PERCH|nr:hypothetical protein FOL47_007650 [Perkinsus chesapeaki]
MTVSRVLASLAAIGAVGAYDMTADFAFDVHDEIKEKFTDAAKESMFEMQKHLREVLSPLHHMVIPAPVATGDPVCVELKDGEGATILVQSAQIDYCEPYGTNMSFVVKIGSVTKTLNLPPFIDPTGGSITVPRFFSHLYNGTACNVSEKVEGGLAGIPEVISVHVEKDVCPGDDPAELWPTVEPKAKKEEKKEYKEEKKEHKKAKRAEEEEEPKEEEHKKSKEPKEEEHKKSKELKEGERKKSDEPKEERKKSEPKEEEPKKADEPKEEEPKKADEPKEEPKKADEPKEEEPKKADEPTEEEPKKADEPKKEEPKKADELTEGEEQPTPVEATVAPTAEPAVVPIMMA